MLFQHDFSSGVEDLTGISEQIRSLQRQNHGALIVCTNPLTFIDSPIQGVILSSMRGHSVVSPSFPTKEKKSIFRWRRLTLRPS